MYLVARGSCRARLLVATVERVGSERAQSELGVNRWIDNHNPA